MNPKATMAIYLLASCGIAALARPGYGLLSGFLILLGGTLGSLKLSIESAQDVRYETLDAGIRFNSEALVVSLVALVVWLIGAGVAFMASKSNWKGGFLASFVMMWFLGSGMNIIWFGLRSL